MITTDSLTLRFGKRVLFEDVGIKFVPGNCYGLIGANGAGKSSFIKLLSGEMEATSGEIHYPKAARLSVLQQDHFQYNDIEVLETVIMGHSRIYEIMKEKEALYAKPDFSEADGIRAGELEGEFADLNGWEAESDAGSLLEGLGIPATLHGQTVAQLNDDLKVRVLLAQALFGNPDILLLDEPTNHLDVDSILWLEEFLINFENLTIVVSHDRHFLDKVCTHIADVDFKKIRLYTGNYTFWYESSQLALQQMRDSNKKKEDKVKELKSFIQRFSANASKSKQATARKKMIDKIDLDEIRPSNRKYPHIVFKPEREVGKELLSVKDLSLSEDGQVLFSGLTFDISKGEQVAFVGPDSEAVSALMSVLAGEREPDSGEIRWGQTVIKGYFPKENEELFDTDMNLVDWLRQYSEDKDENFIRSFLGRMLFTGEESQKSASVLSGGEKVRCMMARLMLQNPNTLLLDGPTNHLDLESIQSLNEALKKSSNALLMQSHDVTFVNSLVNRIIEIKPDGYSDRMMSYEDYLEDTEHRARN